MWTNSKKVQCHILSSRASALHSPDVCIQLLLCGHELHLFVIFTIVTSDAVSIIHNEMHNDNCEEIF